MTPDRYAEILKLARERFPEGAAALHMHGLGLLGGLLDALEELQRIDPERYFAPVEHSSRKGSGSWMTMK